MNPYGYKHTKEYKDKVYNCTQDSLMYFISRQGGCVTEVKALHHPNRNGVTTVKVIKSGILLAKEGEIVKNFNLINGVVRFIEKDFEVRMWDDKQQKWI